MMPYSGRYRVKNLSKYEGDSSKVQYRSLWERQVMRWLDDNPSVIGWNSEEVVIGYRCKTDNRMHRYFVDFLVKVKRKNGSHHCEMPKKKIKIQN